MSGLISKTSIGLSLVLCLSLASIAVAQESDMSAASAKMIAQIEKNALPQTTFDIDLHDRLKLPFVSDQKALEDKLATLIVEGFKNGANAISAEDEASLAAGSVGSPRGIDLEFDERTDLVRALYVVDGTEELTEKALMETMLPVVMNLVSTQIDFKSLSDKEKARLANIVGPAFYVLTERLMLLAAQSHAVDLTKDEIKTLIKTFDIPAQRKLTQVRLKDDGTIGRRATNELKFAHHQIIREFDQ